MKKVIWRENLVIRQGVNDIEIYQLDWTSWLDDETIVDPPTITPEAGITATLHNLNPTSIDMRVSGGQVGTTYTVTVRVVSSIHGRQDERKFKFEVVDQ